MVKVTLFDDLDAVERDAAGELDRAAQPSLYDRLDWYRLLGRHCPPCGALTVARAEVGARRCWLFLAKDGAAARGYTAWYSLRFDVIGEPRLGPAIARALRGSGLATLDLAPVGDTTPLLHALRAGGWIAQAVPDKGNWVVEVGGRDFDAYWSARPGKLRTTAARKARAAGLDITIHDRFDAAAWSAYEEVYRQSWKPEEGSFAFLRALAEQEGAAGTLRLGIARKDGRPVAAQLWITEHGAATIHKIAYVEDMKALSPGTVLSVAMFRRALDQDRVHTIDYGTGDEAYKRDWTDYRRQLWRIRAWNPRTFRGLAGAARAAAAHLVARPRSR